MCWNLARFADNWSCNINQRVEALSNALVAARQSLGWKVKCVYDRRKSWWCATTLGPVVKMQTRARRWFLLAKTNEAKAIYKEWKDYFLLLVLALKMKEWQTLLESATTHTGYKILKLSKRKAGADILPIRQTDGSLRNLKHSQANLLFQGTLAPPHAI